MKPMSKTYRGSLMEPISHKTYWGFLVKPMYWFLHLTPTSPHRTLWVECLMMFPQTSTLPLELEVTPPLSLLHLTPNVGLPHSLEVTQSSIVVMSPWPNSCTAPIGIGDNSISNTRVSIPAPYESHIVLASFNESCLFYINFFWLLEQVSRHSLLPLPGRILWT